MVWLSVGILVPEVAAAACQPVPDDQMIVVQRDDSGRLAARIESTMYGINAACGASTRSSRAAGSAPIPDGYDAELVVMSTDGAAWDVPPACFNQDLNCTATCRGPRGYEDFDQTWGPLTAPDDMELFVGWKPNGCLSTDGQLDFYIVPDACGADGVNIHTVTGNLGLDHQDFTLSPAIDVSGILLPGQTYYIRVVEQKENTECGGTDYHISGLGVFTALAVESGISGTIKRGSAAVAGALVLFKQPEDTLKFTTSDEEGHYGFNDADPSKAFKVFIKGNAE